MRVYVVNTSNCEAWEDYSWGINSIWATRPAAVEYIESKLGMEQCEWADPNKLFRKDRWHKVRHEYDDPSEYSSREEYEDECLDENGDPIPVFTTETDAWIEEYDVMFPSGTFPGTKLEYDELFNLCQWLWNEWKNRRGTR